MVSLIAKAPSISRSSDGLRILSGERAERELREAIEGDADEVAPLHVATWRAAYRGLMPDSVLDGLDVNERAKRYTFGSRLSHGPATLLVVDDGRISGFVTFGPDREDISTGEIYAIYVHPDHWRRGAGRALMGGVSIPLAKGLQSGTAVGVGG
ncbi:GNAT family N-acetyltransferase [Ferrimicrobium sp.]|uniref:GNAT family N-acetyltransferase n=1 Tax=Ferrimicrobium sp. TaxID=2926050 RepID=UPI00262E7A9D|nr:GNAT family N-acetyltransferase [Ferrimicrobium sp.]